MIHNVQMNLFIIILLFCLPDNNSTAMSNDGPEDEHHFIRPLPQPMGFATVNEGITGGEGGIEVTVTNANDLLQYATSNEPYVINVVDTIEIIRGIGNYPERNGAYYIGSNTTIRGAGTNATILYGAFRLSGIQNVIIQNLTFDGTYDPDIHDYKHQLEIGERGPANDAIEITNGSENIWVTQNTFKRYSDECLSINNAASNVTLSWNRFDDPITGQQGMMILIGSGDSQTQDIGRLNTTLHHNYMASRTRHPRTRFGRFHIFNNYYHNIGTYGIASTMDAQILVEANYFENVNNPWVIGYGSSAEGFLVERNNIFVNTVVPATRGELGVEVFDPTDHYEYTPDDPEDIPELVLNGAGAGTGDFSYGVLPIPTDMRTVQPRWGSKEPLQPLFKWTRAVLAEGYEFYLENADGITILDSIVTDTLFVLPFELDEDTSYMWKVRAVNESGASAWTEKYLFSTELVTSVREDDRNSLPSEFKLYNNYPNPFNPDTTIRYALKDNAYVDLRVYDLTGREIAVLVSDMQTAGYHSVRFKADNLSSGIYLYRFRADSQEGDENRNFIEYRTMTFMR